MKSSSNQNPPLAGLLFGCRNLDFEPFERGFVGFWAKNETLPNEREA